MACTDLTEKEANEVLNSLLLDDKIEKPEQVTVLATGNNASYVNCFQSNMINNNETVEGDLQLQWLTPVSLSTQAMNDQQVVFWEGYTVPETDESNNVVKLPKKQVLKKKKKLIKELTKIENCPAEVKARFRLGCECQEESCFRGLSSKSVYKHRLNIAELTKGEHDMYLMGVTMASLVNPEKTVRHKARRRLRAQYIYQGRKVCLDAFLYLENCTHYQLKRIRKHIMTYGVAPRVHGNHGKIPPNTFSLDIYRKATEFLKQYLQIRTGKTDITTAKQIIRLSNDVTRKKLHDAYIEYYQLIEPGVKLMSYSSFRHFMKEQFSYVKFCKTESKSAVENNKNNQVEQQKQQQLQQQQEQEQQEQQQEQEQQPQEQQQQEQQQQEAIQAPVIAGDEVQQLFSLVVAPENDPEIMQSHLETTFFVNPIPQLLLPSSNLLNMQQTENCITPNTVLSYQLANTDYVINEQGNIFTAVANP